MGRGMADVHFPLLCCFCYLPFSLFSSPYWEGEGRRKEMVFLSQEWFTLNAPCIGLGRARWGV